jgi:glycosyltransferase involved in cell wall biosynthesis
MKFSIVTPVLNGMPQIKQCVGSVRRQTAVCWEHIVRDGGSKDGTAEWLRQQKNLTWQTKNDKGMYDAINEGWQQAGGDVLSWLNADEQYLPDTLSLVGRAFEEHEEVDVIFGDYIICDVGSGKALAARKEIPLRRSYVVNGPLYAMSCTMFFRRTLLDRGMLNLDCNLRIAADMDLVIRLLDRGVKFLHIPEYFGLYGLTGRNMSTGSDLAEETLALRSKYGAARSEFVRALIRSMRWLEKLSSGCYGAHNVSYPFMKDEYQAESIEAKAGSSWQ